MSQLDTTQPVGEGSAQAAPGALLRSTAETAAIDPSKVSTTAQPSNPIRQLQAEPLQSTLPAGTPRVLNVTPAQSPSADFNGLHSMLSSLPVPPPHVAAALIRAIMTPPVSGGTVPGASVTTPTVGAPSMGPSAPIASAPTPIQTSAPAPAPAQSSSNRAMGVSVQGPSFTSRANPSANFSSAPQARSAPNTQQNVLNGNRFVGGTVGGAGAAGAAARGFGGLLESLLTEGLGRTAGFGASLLNTNVLRNIPWLNSLFGGSSLRA